MIPQPNEAERLVISLFVAFIGVVTYVVSCLIIHNDFLQMLAMTVFVIALAYFMALALSIDTGINPPRGV